MFSVLIFYCHIRIALLQMNRSQEQGVSTKTWNDLQPPQTFQQPPQKYIQPLANNLKLSKTRHKCLK